MLRRSGDNSDIALILRALGIIAIVIPCMNTDRRAFAQTGTGACCLTGDTCQEMIESACTTAGGTFFPATGCDSNPCAGPGPEPTGACCFDDGDCTADQTEGECTGAGGAWEGDGTVCDPNPCPQPTGACCFVDGDCTPDQEEGECTGAGGAWEGDGTVCDPNPCPIPKNGKVMDRVSMTEKGSLLIFSKVEVRWNSSGLVVQDTFIDITNDYPADVDVLLYFVNGDPPLAANGGERAHPGWNYADNVIKLTKNEPTFWSSLSGWPKGVTPFPALDPGPPPGRPDPEGSGDRVMRGYVVAVAVNSSGEEIRWNHLKGDAILVNYGKGAAWEYNAWAFQVVDMGVDHGMETGTPGELHIDGKEYAFAFGDLLLDFYAVGSSALSGPSTLVTVDPDLTLHPVSADFQQGGEGPVTTKANILVWNMNETKFSGLHRCITCWDQSLLLNYGTPNHFLLHNLQSDKGKARIEGIMSQVCDFDYDFDDGTCGNHPFDVCSENAALLGVAAKFMTYGSGSDHASAGTNLYGMGTEEALILFDLMEPPQEATSTEETKSTENQPEAKSSTKQTRRKGD